MTLSNGAKKWLKSLSLGSIATWSQLCIAFLRKYQVKKKFAVLLAYLGNVKQQENKSLKSFLNRFTTKLSRVRWALDARVLAHLTNGVPPDTPLQDELQQKECKSVNKFYSKASKYLNFESTKEALYKAKEPIMGKDVGQGKKNKENKGGEKRKTKEKEDRSPKKQHNDATNNKALQQKFTNYHMLNTTQDHIYAVSNKSLFQKPEEIRGNKLRRDARKPINIIATQDITLISIEP